MPLKRILMMIDTIWLNVVLPDRSNWTFHVIYEDVAWLLRTLPICAAQMCLYTIATKFNASLDAAHPHIDDDRYDMVECSAPGEIKLDLSRQL